MLGNEKRELKIYYILNMFESYVLRRKKSIKVIYVRIICYWWYFGFSYNYIYEGGRVSEVGVIWDLVVLFDRDLFLLIIIVCYF